MIATDGAIELGIHPHPSLLTSSTCHSLHRLVFSFLSLFLLSFISFLHFFPSFLSVPQLSAPASFSFFSSGLSAPGPFERCLFSISFSFSSLLSSFSLSLSPPFLPSLLPFFLSCPARPSVGCFGVIFRRAGFPESARCQRHLPPGGQL